MMSSDTPEAKKQFRLNHFVDQSKLFAKYQKKLLLDLMDESKKIYSSNTDQQIIKQFCLSFKHGVPTEKQIDNFIEMYNAFSGSKVKLEIYVDPKKKVTKFILVSKKKN